MPPTAGAAYNGAGAAAPTGRMPRLPRASCTTHRSPPASVDARHPDHRVSGGYGLIAPGSDRTATTLSSSHSVVSEAAGFRPTRSWKVDTRGFAPMAAGRYELASQSDGLGFRGVLGRENRSLTEALTAELAGIRSWVVGRVGPADRQGKFTWPMSSADSILALQDFVSPVAAFVRDGGEVGTGHEIPIADLLGDWRL